MTKHLCGCGHAVNRKRVRRLMQKLGLAGMAPGPNTSKAHPQHTVCPYLPRGVDTVRPNQVWSADITYIRLLHGFVCLVAIIDWYSRKVLAWRLSNTLDAGFCVDCLEEAIKDYGAPEVFNTGQGPQFTSAGFTGVLLKSGITVGMGRYLLLQYLHSPHPCRSRTRTGIGQYFCRAAVADSEI